MSERKIRKDKKIKVLAGLSQIDHDKLQMLAISCNMTKTKLAEHMLMMCLNNESIVHWYQEKYNTEDKYRITIVKTNDGIEYI